MTQQEAIFKNLSKVGQKYLIMVDEMARMPDMEKDPWDLLSENMMDFCRMLEIGKVEMILDVPAGRLHGEEGNGRRLIFSDGVVNIFHPYSKTFSMGEAEGKVTFEIYWKRDEHIPEESLFWAEILADHLFIHLGLMRLNLMLKRALGTDHTTGLPTVDTYLTRIQELIDQKKIMDYSAAFFNIRNFRYINKLVDYQSGDDVMCQYADKVSDLLDQGEMLARLGGDNYVVLVRKERLETFLDRLDELWVDVATHSGVRRIYLPARVGIFNCERSTKKPGEVMLAISCAMQVTRLKGKGNRVYYTPDMSQELLYEKKVSLDFVNALEQGQFRAYYQPKIDLETGKVCGAEALARWEKRSEVLLPARFVPMLEKDGAVCKLDFEILRQTCEMIAGWKAKGYEPVPISINMSRWHLRDRDLSSRVDEVLARYDIEPKWIEIEITETVDYEEYVLMKEIMSQFRKKGYLTSIDDFGSGYSSLNMLHKMEVDILKLDRGFLWEESEKAKVLIRNVIRMAKDLGITVLAEGVENTSQRDFLIASGCDMAQGFLYAMPLKKEDFERRAFS
ncbi:MAG: bifunctional diguanylate cyclase/phosphodiesterase [Lachnospiraceae bacterium]|nr:bifunctional diguanylate cyclase/phosphodiesterase [Lachnospiraceae bacterium]